ncbi:transcriptional regulator [Streptomyces daqingensis]|uniref:Transcriptional regulator n=1 Tax=Streptomyces daqingensis TaxID=1472640 RepID=A0ABQ2MLE0_9ACTN|nr:metalloregulator ArsR/SmtB family transcription factor [Streptomyces daqingensis]GGO53999.1 transcriptional regulator [Streptomyces daqingensis]
MSDRPLAHETLTEYAGWFRALSDPTRILIVDFLTRQPRPVPAGAVVDHLRMSQPTVSHHLRTLHQVRIVTRHRAGANMLYAIDARCSTELPRAAAELLGAARRQRSPAQ